jgi:hypothetical protein
MTMKRIFFPTLFFGLFMTVLFAGPALSGEEGAEIWRDSGVYMGVTGSGLACGLITYDSIIVQSADGNVVMTAKFDIHNNQLGDCTPDELTMANGFPCNIIAQCVPDANGWPTCNPIEISVSTSDTHFVATPGGMAMLKCKFKSVPGGYKIE